MPRQMRQDSAVGLLQNGEGDNDGGIARILRPDTDGGVEGERR